MVSSNDIGLKANKDLSLDGLTFPPSLTFKQPTVIFDGDPIFTLIFQYHYSDIIMEYSTSCFPILEGQTQLAVKLSRVLG